MKRAYPSGAKKRKKTKERKSNTECLPKLTTFFSPKYQNETSEEEEEPAMTPTEQAASTSVTTFSSSGEECPVSDTQPPPHDPVVSEIVLSDDPALWPEKISDQQRCSIVKRGPVQIKDFDFPQNCDKTPRRFTAECYYKKMKNEEKIQRNWLVYSVSSDSVFCFCCKLFERGSTYSLSSGGFRSWINIHSHLKEHEKGKAHRANMQTWRELEDRLKSGKAIDSVSQELHVLETQHWKAVLNRIIAIVCHLAEHNQALRGHSEKLFEPHNGNFLGQVELMAQFDPIMSEHLRRIEKKEIKDHYLSNIIQNELIVLVGEKTKDAILQKVKKAKYFSVIMDCTPDISHNEQLSLVLRIVNCESLVGANIAEHFVGFVNVNDTTGKGLFDTLIEHLNSFRLNISDCRGQSYDNGSNMMGHKQGVQKRLLEINNKALCVPCSSHSLNLVVVICAFCDIFWHSSVSV